MKKKIFQFGFLFLTVFIFNNFFINSVFAQAVDTTPPIISLIGLNPVSLNVGDAYIDAGATALDDDDTDLTLSIITVNPVDVEIAGTYIITYNVADHAGNNAIEVTRTINVNTVSPPEPDPEPEPDEDADLFIEEDITLENGCEVEDTNGVTHIFPSEDSSDEFLAICALAEALEQGFVDDIEFVDFGFGLFVNRINGISQENAYWQLRKNDASASVGASQLALEMDDVVSLVLTAFDPETFEEEPLDYVLTLRIIALVSLPDEEPEEEEEIEETPPSSGGGGGGGGSFVTPPTFSIPNALAYLKSVQGLDGSFDSSSRYTDWVAIAFGSQNETGSSHDLLLSYLTSNNTISSLLTDNERRAMAILSLGQNPYSFNGVNYVNAIIEAFDGTQFGEVDLVNDDIFALIPLKNSGYTVSDDIITKALAFIISKQNTNGSWVDSVDITAAAIQALKDFESVTGVPEALSKANDYLESKQNTDGGWGNVFSTSWIMQAESALNTSWTKNGKNGLDYLATQQATDGAVSSLSETLANRIWATSYAIVAVSEKSWSEIMQSVSKPTTQNDLNISSTDVSENSASQTPFEPVVCPPGDLFNTTTGQACTVTSGINPLTVNTPVVSQNINNSLALRETPRTSPIRDEIPENDEPKEIIFDTLTANVEKSGNQIPLPITIGGIVILGVFILTRFFKVII